MKTPFLIPGFAAVLGAGLVISSAFASESSDALKAFATYEQGKPLGVLIDTRRKVFLGTADDAVRSERERELLAFIASDAHPQAKAIAIEWLGSLGSAASVPELTAAGKDPALASPVAAAIERIRGPKAAAAGKPGAPVICKNAAEAAAFATAIEAHASDPKGDDRIVAALLSNNPVLAGSALQRIRAGAGSPALPGKLLASLDKVPVSRQIPLCEALAPRPDAAAPLRQVLLARVKRGDPESRAAAVRTFGRILRPAELPLVLDLVNDTATPGLSAAAKAALIRATDPQIDPTLIRLASGEAPTRIAAIDALAARNALAATDSLWSLTSSKDPKVAAAAYEALGTLLPPEELPVVLKNLTSADGSPSADELGKLFWNVIRRHPDPAAASAWLDEQLAIAPEGAKELLIRYADRIRPKTSAPAQPALELPKSDDRARLMPNGYEQVAYLDCGSLDRVAGEGAAIRRTAGQSYQFGSIAHALATVDFGKEITYEITGLDPAAEYVLGFSSWDADQNGRRQSLSVNQKELLPDFAPISYHADKPTYTRIHLPLAKEDTAAGNATVTMTSVSGPNAVISELWLLRRKADASTAKRVVILTGDDHPAHLWRLTGPEFAATLRADPRLDVTITESPSLLGSSALSSYDVVFLHFKNYQNRLPTSSRLWENLDSHVRGGGGLVIAHFGCGAMQEWNGFVKVAGRVWDPKKRAHDPYGAFEVRILQKGHPVTKGLPDFETTDELYTCLSGDTGIEVLAEATSKVDRSVHPMAFVLTPEKGRVFHSPLGHDLGALKAKGARAIYLRGTLWAAGLTDN